MPNKNDTKRRHGLEASCCARDVPAGDDDRRRCRSLVRRYGMSRVDAASRVMTHYFPGRRRRRGARSREATSAGLAMDDPHVASSGRPDGRWRTVVLVVDEVIPRCPGSER